MLYIAQKSSAFSPRMELPATQAKSANQGRMKFAGKRPIPPIQANEIRGYTGKSPPARTQEKTANQGRMKFGCTQGNQVKPTNRITVARIAFY
jgi:hypothetical protein